MLNEERKRKIVDITNERKSVTINELMEILGASQSTIRRDLSELNHAKMLKKVHGGAISLKNNILTKDETVLHRQDLNTAYKKEIAQYAASLVKESDVVYLDAGTTTAEMLPFLRDINATYITNCIKADCSQTFTQFVNTYRIDFAKQLLTEHPDKKMLSVAIESGFTTDVWFFRTFKSITGMTPTEWREQQTVTTPENTDNAEKR